MMINMQSERSADLQKSRMSFAEDVAKEPTKPSRNRPASRATEQEMSKDPQTACKGGFLDPR